MAPPSLSALLSRRGSNRPERDPPQSPHQQSANADQQAGENPKSSELRAKHIDWLEKMEILSTLLVSVESVPMSQEGYANLRDFTEQMRTCIKIVRGEIDKEITNGCP